MADSSPPIDFGEKNGYYFDCASSLHLVIKNDFKEAASVVFNNKLSIFMTFFSGLEVNIYLTD